MKKEIAFHGLNLWIKVVLFVGHEPITLKTLTNGFKTYQDMTKLIFYSSSPFKTVYSILKI
jgi:hypothetical protein